MELLVPFIYRLWYDVVPGPPALKASILPLGYRGSGCTTMIVWKHFVSCDKASILPLGY